MRNLAVIDIGSNSVRLFCCVQTGAEKQMLETTRLGQGVAERMLQPEPVRRTVEAIGMFCRLARETGRRAGFRLCHLGGARCAQPGSAARPRLGEIRRED